MSRDAKTLGGIVYAKLREYGADSRAYDALSELIALAMHGERLNVRDPLTGSQLGQRQEDKSSR